MLDFKWRNYHGEIIFNLMVCTVWYWKPIIGRIYCRAVIVANSIEKARNIIIIILQQPAENTYKFCYNGDVVGNNLGRTRCLILR